MGGGGQSTAPPPRRAGAFGARVRWRGLGSHEVYKYSTTVTSRGVPEGADRFQTRNPG